MSTGTLIPGDKIPGDGVCVTPACDTVIQRNRLMCRPCWFSLSMPTRAAVNTTWRDYRSGHATLGELREVQQRAILEIEAR